MKTPVALGLAALFLAGCAKNIDTSEAVKQGIVKDIAKKVDVQNMDVSVNSVSFRGKEANAQVSFSPKGAGASQSITMSYTMERQGDEWHIKGRSMQSHDPSTPGQSALPPGHPAANGATPLPAGHPAVSTAPKP